MKEIIHTYMYVYISYVYIHMVPLILKDGRTTHDNDDNDDHAKEGLIFSSGISH